MLFLPTRGYFYVAFAIGILLPGLVAWFNPSPATISCALVLEAAVFLPCYFCSNDRFSYISSMSSLTAQYASGCANLTVLYILGPILFYWLVAVRYSLIGIVKGRETSRKLWFTYCAKRIIPHEFALDHANWDVKEVHGIWTASTSPSDDRSEHFALFRDGTYVYVNPFLSENALTDIIEAGTWGQHPIRSLCLQTKRKPMGW